MQRRIDRRMMQATPRPRGNTDMKNRRLLASLASLATGFATIAASAGHWANAADGLAPRADEWLWPQVQARITLNTVSTATLGPVSLLREGAARSVQGGSVLGDYVLASPAFGSLRATSGLMLGSTSGATLSSGSASPRLSISTLDQGWGANGPVDSAHATPYLGLGYNTPLAWRSVSLSADLGVVAERPSGIPGFGRALFGSGGIDSAWREMRVAPMVQLSVRYSF
jgi:hypothetical protein